MRKLIAYAPVDGVRGKLYIDSCKGETLGQYRIYKDEATARSKKVSASDVVAKVTIVVED